MITHPYVEDYIKLWKSKKIRLNQERVELIHYLERAVLSRDDVFFDEDEINRFTTFTEKWFFKLQPFQKFLVAFIFLFYRSQDEDGNDRPVFNEFLITMGRGGGKSALISALATYFISPLCKYRRYNVDVVANSEQQAKVSFDDVYDMLTKNPGLYSRSTGHFDRWKSVIRGRANNSEFKFWTSNPGTKDGFRPGVLIFDEIHEYLTDAIIDVLRGGLGKVKPDRTFYIGTNGFVREGVYDSLMRRSLEVLDNDKLESKLFPFICKLDDKAELENRECWQKANPMFHPPLNAYSRGLLDTYNDEYQKIRRGQGNKPKFLTKRMNIADVALESSIADRETIYSTNQEMPDLTGELCIGGLDYASMRDFASVGLLFRKDGKYYWITKSFVRKGFLDEVALSITDMIPSWQKRDLIEVVDEPSISIEQIVDWFVDMREKYNFNRIVGDIYRMDLVRSALEAEGFEIDFIRQARAIEAKIAVEVEVHFAQHNIVYGDNPLMRWFTNNVYVKMDKFGNKTYEKKEPVRRKTDGFMAFVHAYWGVKEYMPEEADDFYLADFFA